MADSLEFREYVDEDFATFLVLHNDVFPPVSEGEMAAWMARDDVTAGVAILDGRVVGEIPLHIRDFMVRPGVHIRAAFEHSVCVAESMRGTGLGTQIQTAMKQFLIGRAEALTVYRGGERTPAYRFYDQNGLVDLTYHRHYEHTNPAAVASRGFEPVDISEIIANEAQILRVFEDALGHAAGRQIRRPGFFTGTFTNLEMCELKPRMTGILAEESDGLAGYCILLSGHKPDSPLRIAEVAARGRNRELIESLVRSACSMAAERGVPATVSLHDYTFCWRLFTQLGFTGSPRGEMIMGTPLDWHAMAQRVWWRQPALDDVQVNIATPERDLTIHEPTDTPARTLTLEMKHHQASRYLFSRLDLPAQIRSEMVTCHNATKADIEALGRALPFAPWEIRDIEHI